MTRERILFVRTFRPVGTGGPIPPVGLLYLAAVIRESFGERYTVGIYDCGLPAHGRQHLLERIQAERPGIIGFSTMCCEAEWMHELAGAVREAAPEAVILVGGPHPTVVAPELPPAHGRARPRLRRRHPTRAPPTASAAAARPRRRPTTAAAPT